MSQIESDRLAQCNPKRALVLSSAQDSSNTLCEVLRHDQWHVDSCRSLGELLRLAETHTWSFVLIAEAAASSVAKEAMKALCWAIESGRTQVVVLAERKSADEAMVYIELGAMDYLAWPVVHTQVLALAERARRSAAEPDLITESEGPVREGKPQPSHSLIGASQAMIELSKQLIRVARRTDVPVLISGETGVGKEVIARQLHQRSGKTGSFCAINCATLGENLTESELFGHEKGAFTGALSVKRGLWEEAAEGTLFLDEITEAPPLVQSKLLRALQEGVIRRLGATREIRVTARIIAASNRDLKQAIKEGIFREDLYFRFKKVLRVPPLRERIEDVPELIEYFIGREGRGLKIMPEAIELLCRYDWPGNVRELESLITELTINCSHCIYPEDVLPYLQVPTHHLGHALDLFMQSVMNSIGQDWPTIHQIRNRIVVQAFLHFGHAFQTAKALGMDYRTVGAILKEELGYQAVEKQAGAGSLQNQAREVDSAPHFLHQEVA